MWLYNINLKSFFFFSFRLLSSSLLLYLQRFSRCVLRPSSCVSCRAREPSRNFETRPLFNPREGVAYFDFVNHKRVQVLIIPVLLLACSQD